MVAIGAEGWQNDDLGLFEHTDKKGVGKKLIHNFVTQYYKLWIFGLYLRQIIQWNLVDGGF